MNYRQYSMSPTEAALWIGVSRSTIYRLMRQGEIPVIKVGRRTLLQSEHLEAFVSGRSQIRSPQGPTEVVVASEKPSPCPAFRSPMPPRKDRRRPRAS